MSEEVVKQVFNYGTPAVFLLLICLGSWKILWAVGSFLAPLITQLFSTAQRFLETNVTFLQKMEVLGDGLLKQQEAQTALMQRTDGKISEIHDAVVVKR